MFWLVLYYTSVVIIPEAYPTEKACIAAGELWINKQYKCIPSYHNCFIFKDLGNGSGMPVPTYCEPTAGK